MHKDDDDDDEDRGVQKQEGTFGKDTLINDVIVAMPFDRL